MEIETSLDTLDALVLEIDRAESGLRTAQADRLIAIHGLSRALPTDRHSAACDAVIAEIATSLHVSTRSASRLYDDAELICTRPHVIAALAQGRLDLTRAKLIATLLPTSDLQDRLEADAIHYGSEHTTYHLRKWLLSRLPDGDEVARKTAFDQRRIEVVPDRDGMSELYGYLPTDVAEAFFTALDTLARTNTVPDEDRTLDQRRADALTDLLDDKTTVATTVSVVLPASGIGATVNDCPLPWSNAMMLACRTNATWFAWMATPTGRVINTSPRQYRIPTALARTVRARDQHCRFPGCSVPAARCDLDHTIAHPDGDTTADNLHCLCRRHHRIKHQTGWTVTNLGSNELEWTSPAGRTYRTKPPDTFNCAA